ncbi:MAG: sugar phosphate isomerase/epimerase family protein [Verrucomicrobiales bacterium]
MDRRQFVSCTLAGLGTASLRAIEPFNRPGASRMALGVAAYSFRDYFRWVEGKEQPPREGREPWELRDFIDWCADHGVPGAELTSYYFPPGVDEAALLAIKRHAFLRGVEISGTAVGNNFALPKGPKLEAEIAATKQWIDRAAVMGAPHVRVFAGAKPGDLSDDEAFANCLAAYQECLDHAAKKGIFLGLENHGGIVAEPEALVRLVRAANSPWAGINLDSGNFNTEDPYADLALIAPYAVNVQLKTEMRRRGAPAEPADLARLVSLLRDAGYQGWFIIEFEAQGSPFSEIPRWLDILRPMLA